MHRFVLALVLGIAAVVGFVYAIGIGWIGEDVGPGTPTEQAAAASLLTTRAAAQRAGADAIGAVDAAQILFGDLHVHTTYSTDAYLMSLPLAGGDGARPVADACDFARHCSALDFWSINDHAGALTQQRWDETVDAIRQCNAIAGDEANPDVVAYLGWEWTQIGTTPENHYGHKNVVLRDLEPDRIPDRPIAANSPATIDSSPIDPWSLGFGGMYGLLTGRSEIVDLATYLSPYIDMNFCKAGVPVRDLPRGCLDFVETPGELFAKLDDWGHASVVIPHGTTWGLYTPQGASWEKQLTPEQHDPARQTLVEVYSGHGNSEEYRAWRAVETAPDGSVRCPEPTKDYLPSCWQAGEIIRARCHEAGESDTTCEQRAADARQYYADAASGSRTTVPAATPEDWLDSGQCRDCFQASFNHRPRSSVQAMMALRNHDLPEPMRFRFGFLASSDNHTGRPGTGYKEFARTTMTEARLNDGASLLFPSEEEEPAAQARPFDLENAPAFFARNETERQASFFVTGGLTAVHAKGRSRGAIWDALEARQVYGTSGPRILLWFDLLNAPRVGRMSMGSEVEMRSPPAFEVRAVGSFEPKPGCPEETSDALTPERIADLCRGECYHPSDVRRPITQIEVVRIRPQARSGEPIAPLIEDPWKRFDCPGDPTGCTAVFVDEEFAASGRHALYYARAIEAPSPTVNGGFLRCERDAAGECVETRPCRNEDPEDDCLAPSAHRAWSSPIFIDHARGI
jgi:hypothetical protein